MNPAAEWLEDEADQWCDGLRCSPATLIRTFVGRWIYRRCAWCGQVGICVTCKRAHEDQPCQGTAA